ncbi:hypothetical protein LPJ71_011315, partial [Coemansia sp. S17]
SHTHRWRSRRRGSDGSYPGDRLDVRSRVLHNYEQRPQALAHVLRKKVYVHPRHRGRGCQADQRPA